MVGAEVFLNLEAKDIDPDDRESESESMLDVVHDPGYMIVFQIEKLRKSVSIPCNSNR